MTELSDAFSRYLAGRLREARYSSFDYCFNYFQSFRERDATDELVSDENLQLSCLHLGYFLGSWGMFRGKGLMSRSLWGMVPVIRAIADEPETSWTLDVPNYATRSVEVLGLRTRINATLPSRPNDTLITKTLLGVFGCVPALDTYFTAGYDGANTSKRLTARLLKHMSTFYNENAVELEALRVPTIDFLTGAPTQRTYPMAKIFDQIFFQIGFEESGDSDADSN